MGNYRAVFTFTGTGFWAVVAWSFGFTPIQITASSALALIALLTLALIALLTLALLLAPPSKDEAAPVRDERR